MDLLEPLTQRFLRLEKELGEGCVRAPTKTDTYYKLLQVKQSDTEPSQLYFYP
jgi:hypothetical protein